ncbi:P-loop ATPase, Sll1717 family [Teredinibacter turnerae]|uniref:P-loop ATPase, Sll1717 family n=1 Tax=Teredinibacter turnerae TaxID=2426 RepID=UPI0030CEB189
MTQKLLEEIEEWKLEAKLESSDRYFFHTRIVDRLSCGKKLYVIGRKGTGKTAICEYLSRIENDSYYSQKLTFKNFPFNVLYELEDSGYTSPNQYITLWKFLIYSTICRMLSDNPNVDLESRQELKKIYNDDLSSALPKAVSRWTGFKFDLKIFGSGIGFGGNKGLDNNNLSISEKVDILEKFISGKLGAESYVILFDELDEDYKDIIEPEKYKKYTELLTSLFKAVQDVRSKFKKHKVYPIVFLRDDIYEVLQDPDKNKWTDYKVELEWNRDSLKNLLAFRISKAISKEHKVEAFASAWGRVFEGGDVKYGHQDNKSISVFDYITRSTQNRPRDYIRYLQICAYQSLEKEKVKISPKVVKAEGKTFSNYLRTEMEDEIHGAIPEIKNILNLFTKMRKQTLHISDFKELYESEVEAGNLPKRDYQFILEMLFMFSVIGNIPSQSLHHVFRYENKEARLNMSEKICVHRGLFRALQIL